MAEYIFGIYGFDFSTRSQVRDLELIPLYTYPECQDRGHDERQFLLTGYGRLPLDTEMRHVTSYTETIRRLTDGMTFCQQQYVLLTRLIRVSAGDTIDAMIQSQRLATRLLTLQSRHTSGAAIGSDTFFPQSRIDFLERFLNHLDQSSGLTYELTDEITDPTAKGTAERTLALTAALYRQIEIWRLSAPYVELEHFLAFSGLEILGRAYGPYPDNHNAAVPISGLLRSKGFSVTQSLAEEWCLARNGAFHRGKLKSTHKESGKTACVIEQAYLTTLLADLSLKLLGFDDGHINWERWQDRQPFF